MTEPFDGDTFDPEHDGERLGTLLSAVFELMRDGQWRTLAEIREELGRGSEASLSARLRDFRKEKHGGHLVHRRRVGEPSDGLYQYQLEVCAPPLPPLADEAGQLLLWR